MWVSVAYIPKEKIIGLTISNEMKIETKEILSATSIISFALCKINTIVYSKGENSIIVYDMKEEKEVEQITFNDKIKMIIKDDEYIISFGEEKNIYIINEENYALVTKVYLNSIFSFNSVSLYNHRIYYNEDNKGVYFSRFFFEKNTNILDKTKLILIQKKTILY